MNTARSRLQWRPVYTNNTISHYQSHKLSTLVQKRNNQTSVLLFSKELSKLKTNQTMLNNWKEFVCQWMMIAVYKWLGCLSSVKLLNFAKQRCVVVGHFTFFEHFEPSMLSACEPNVVGVEMSIWFSGMACSWFVKIAAAAVLKAVETVRICDLWTKHTVENRCADFHLNKAFIVHGRVITS